MTTYKLNSKLSLSSIQVPVAQVVTPVEVPTNHILVIDCSGSMSWDLPRIREQLKKKLPKMVGERDTVSIIWFSGKSQYGTLLEGEPVATLADLNLVNKAIDRWLQPMGLTGFKEPLLEASALVDRLSKARPNSAFSLLFLSDGCDNQWLRADILKAMEACASKLHAMTCVEYGYYADRPMLTAMAESAGGTLVFADGFDKYVPILEASLSKRPTSVKKVEVKIPHSTEGGFAFYLDGEVYSVSVRDGVVLVPEGIAEVFYVSDASATEELPQAKVAAAYAAMSLYATRMLPDVVLACLQATGDVLFIDQFASCFGKQAYTDFQDATKQAAFNASARLLKGKDHSRIPREDAFTVLELISALDNDPDARLFLDHSAFAYSRIGRGRVDSSEVLSAEEQAEVENLTTKLASTKNAKEIAELAAQLAKLTEGKEKLVFTPDSAPDGYPVNGVVWNEERPNISIRVCKTGHVDLSSRLSAEVPYKGPAIFPTFIFRNYALVKDGLVNVAQLPVKLGKSSAAILSEAVRDGRLPVDAMHQDGTITVINLRAMPVINRQMVRKNSAKALFLLEWELTRARAAQKVFKDYAKNLVGERESKGFVETYGKEAADWLKEQGITDYSGFSPKSVQADATDMYLAKEMAVSIKSYSSLPTLKVAREKAAKGKLTPSEALIYEFIQKVESYLQGEGADGKPLSDMQKRMLLTWLESETAAVVAETRMLLQKKAMALFVTCVGQTWFTEFESLDQNSMNFEVNGIPLACKVEMREVETKV